jgi:hypothetical protein
MAPSEDEQATVETTAAESSTSVESLPSTAIALIYHHCNAGTRNSLLRTSRWGRDLVLGQARRINFRLGDSDTSGTRKPLVRLLDRACSAGEDGSLTLSLRSYVHNNKVACNNLLNDLLAPGIQQHGWASVGVLELWVSAVLWLMQPVQHDVGNSLQSKHLGVSQITPLCSPAGAFWNHNPCQACSSSLPSTEGTGSGHHVIHI